MTNRLVIWSTHCLIRRLADLKTLVARTEVRHRLQSAIPHSHRFLLQRASVRAGASAMVLGGKGGGAGHGHRRMAAAAVQRWDWGGGPACHLDRTRSNVAFSACSASSRVKESI